MVNREGLLVVGGDAPQKWPQAYIRREFDRSRRLVVAADSGLYHLFRWGVQPDVVVGDMDSLQRDWLEDHYPHVPRHSYPRDKDETDTEIGMRYLRDAGIRRITVAGGGGGRLDHLMGLLTLFERPFCPSLWLTGDAEVRVIEETYHFTAVRGETVSFFPAGPDTCHMTSDGLRWPLNGLVWKKGDAGISNECVGEQCRVKVLSGRLLMVRSLCLLPELPSKAT